MAQSDVVKALEKNNNLLIIAHQKPDGDALGSAIALGLGLKQLGKNVDYYIDPNIEERYRFLEEIENFNQDLKENYDALVLVDCSTLDFSYKPEGIDFDELILIDHHKSNKIFGDKSFVEISGAAGELVYKVLKDLGVEISPKIKEAIFTAISSDTGSFQFSNVTNQTHQIVSELYDKDTNFAPVSKKIHSQKDLNQLNMYANAINNLETYHDGRLAVIPLSFSEIEKNGGDLNLTDDLANIGMNLNTSEISALIKEIKPGEFRVSLRSKSPFDYDVSKIALKFGGGGHLRASGYSREGDLEEVKKELIHELDQCLTD